MNETDSLKRGPLPLIRKALTAVIPDGLRNHLARWHVAYVQRQYASLSLSETFSTIYDTRAWATPDCVATSPHSGPGSRGEYVERYRALVLRLLSDHHVQSLVDLGCGDFETGKTLIRSVVRYTGVDIVPAVIEANRARQTDSHVAFVCADITRDALPPADAAIVRQVFQHLTNQEIRAALDNVLHTYGLVIVTEHVYAGDNLIPNLDMPHGPGTRVSRRSGVFIDLPPFCVAADRAPDIPYSENEVLRTWVLKGAARP